jgi:hypothetical protein
MPDQRIILASYGDALATDFGRKVRNEFQSNKHCQTKLAEDSSAVGRWSTPAGGGRVATGVGGPLSGRGFNVGIIDDPIKNWQEAHSYQTKQVLLEWFHSVFLTRAEPNASIIIAMTRWADDDLCATLQREEPGRWEVVSLPALAVGTDPMGRVPGAPLMLARYDRAALAAIKLSVGKLVWDALFQQNPQPFGAGRLYGMASAANIDPQVTLKNSLPLQLAFDFNINPGMHVLIGQYDPTIDMFSVVTEIYKPRMNVRTAMDAVFDWMKRHGWAGTGRIPWPELHVFGDASGSAQWAGTGESNYDIVGQKLRSAGVTFRKRHPPSNPAIVDRVNTVNEALNDVEGKGHIKVHPACVELIKDFTELKADEHGLIDKHEHSLSHSSDALGYWVNFLRPLWRSNKRHVGGRVG